MHRRALGMLGALLLVSSCTVPTAPLLSAVTVDTGSVCAPTDVDGTVSIAFDLVDNITQDPVRVLSVELAAPQDLELLATQVRVDLEAAHVGGDHGGPVDGDWAPLVLQPGEQALVQVVLRPTDDAPYGWTNGLWVMAETESGRRVRMHTCHALLVSADGPCALENQPSDDDTLNEMCGRSERG